ncbi:hypothetical protein VF21_05945 [Pseudogymnoascus sp. 05NY08]|nr:hypothetical protein VF21_05945 [Pseudogymnoascus sp. 05NY08]
MAPRYQHSHSIDAIIESPDEDLAGSTRGASRTISDKKQRRDGNPSPTTTTSAHSKEKSRKSHHRSSFSSGSKHVSSKSSKPKANSAKRYAPAHGEMSSQSLVRQHPRHGRRDKDSDSSSSEEEDEEEEGEEEPKDYRSVLAAARGRLTSPSLLSTMTSLTTATNNSGGSSGSNSTITQASMSRTETVQEVTISGTTEEAEEGPLSPAAPDPPNVFAYLDEDSSSSDEDEEEDSDSDSDADENENEDGIQYAPHAPSPAPHPNDSETPDSHSDDDDSHPQTHAQTTTWLHPLSPTSTSADDATPMAPTFSSSHARTPSLSSASSFAASDTSSRADIDIDTDRSTSPEQSLKGSPSPTPRLLLSRPPPGTGGQPALASPTEAKLAAQMRAAQMRQEFHSAPGGYHQHHHRQQQHTPTPLSLHPPPHQESQALSPRLPQLSGYDALATHLTTSPPVYRRFATLNHRLLLHMQDELSELESHLAALDAADAASRTLSLPPTPSSAVARSPSGRRPRTSTKNDDRRAGGREVKTHTHPSSRRASAQHPSQLDHHRADLLARVGYKMAQYNASLTSFAKTSRLPDAEREDVEAYRTWLGREKPVVWEEGRFLEREGDLISLGPPAPAPAAPAPTPAEVETVQRTLTPPPVYHHPQQQQNQQPHTQRALLLAALASILLPVLMFTVVPNFVGRIAVAVLVAGMLWGMVSAQGGGMRGLVGGGGGWGLVWGWGAGILVAAVVV